MIEKLEEIIKDKSIEEIINGLLKNQDLTVEQCVKALKEVKKEAEKITNKNNQLEEEIIEKDKGIEFLNGRIDGMEYVIEHLNLNWEDKQL
ncbi:MAG: hypothetical protein HFJ60_07985 [Clostridia bacterium]|jgi:uncharacterized protein YoxC|nr:hypothetical protein [Clostridia bacterium]